MSDEKDKAQRTAMRGSAFDGPAHRNGVDNPVTTAWQRCIVLDVHPDTYTCDVKTERGQYYGSLPWPRIFMSPDGMAGDVSVPMRGQTLAIHNELTEPQLSFTIPHRLDVTTPPGEHRIVHGSTPVGGQDGVYTATGRQDYRGGMPADLLPGDWARVGSQGNLVAVLEGGTTVLKASELSKVIANSVGDLLQLIGRNTDLYSDFGEIRFRNQDGRVSMSLRGGSQQTTETHTEQEKFTIRADLGHTGELVDFRITDTKGRTIAQSHWKPDGTVERYADKALHEVVGTSYTFETTDKDETISGSYTFTVGSNVNGTVGGSLNQQVQGNVEFTSGNDTVLTGNRDTVIAAGRFFNVAVSGSATNLPGATAYSTVVTNGSYVIDIGNPAAGDIQAALSGFQLTTYLGDIQFGSTLGKVKIRTTLPASVEVGGQQGTFSAMLFELFEVWATAFGTAIDTHTHGTSVGPTTPPVVPPYASTQGSITPIKSTYVKLGG